MFRKTIFILSGLLGLITLTVIGCGGGSGNTSPVAATVQKQNGYYEITLNLSSASHREVGRQLALALQDNIPNYEQIVDSFIKTQMDYYTKTDPNVKWSTMVDRAKTMAGNGSIPHEYLDEIAGMQEIFNAKSGTPGDGKLSADELLVYQLFADVFRLRSCSAAAAYGDASETGYTIIGRNTDWLTKTYKDFAQLQSIFKFKNGSKTFVNIGFAGMLNASNAINQSHVFAGMLDSQTYLDYPRDVSDKRSIPFDLRYAIENFTTLGEVAAYMSSPAHIYAMNNIIVVADRNTAGVIENDMNDVPNPNRSLRVDTSAFNPKVIIDGRSWPRQNWTQTGDFWSGANDYLRNVVASVNDFRLLGNYFLPNDDYNRARWESYRACFANALGNTPDAQCTVINSRTKIGVDQMKRIVGYTGPGPAVSDLGKFYKGAIFGSEPLEDPIDHQWGWATLYSFVMRMDTLEMWIHFAPVTDTPPLNPTYQKINNIFD